MSGRDFIRTIIDEHMRTGAYGGRVATRFPPEPNGYLHIGHAKSICLNFGLAQEYGGHCNLRFDDTDPTKEEAVFEEAIEEAVRWLGFSWGDKAYHASDYFDTLYDLAVKLIQMGKAYVCSLSLEEIRAYRGSVTEPGRPSPYRERSVEENLDLFARMRAGEFKDGEHVLRAKIDMAAANMKMRDPLLYRIRHVSHHRTGDRWCIYPLYDFTHCLSDSIENITHSICTLEFENNRELYDWIIDTLDMPNKPRQYEFGRLNINYTVMSKRKILQLVEEKRVDGWDDPRLLTIAGLRRRGYTPEAIRKFCASVGVAKANSVVDMAQLEHAIRDDLNTKAPRVFAVLEPLKVTITNYPEGKSEAFDAPYFPEGMGRSESRQVPFSREIYIERSDFEENPPKGYYRLSPGAEVRLRYAYIIRCEEVIKDASGRVIELRCRYDEATPVGENPADGRKIKGTIHWLSKEGSIKADVRAYDRLFTVPDPGMGEHEDFLAYINQDSLIDYPEALVERGLRGTSAESHFQFERHGYFVTDQHESRGDRLVFNRIVTLKDSWKRQQGQESVEALKQVASLKSVEKMPAEEAVLELTPEQNARKEGLMKAHGIGEDYAVILVQNSLLCEIFEEAVRCCNQPKEVANWVINDLASLIKERGGERSPISAGQLAELVQMVCDGAISSKIAKEIFPELVDGASPKKLVEEKGLTMIDDQQELGRIIDRLFVAHPDVIEQIRGGRQNRVGFIVGQVMKETGGRADPQLVNALIQSRLGE